MDHSLILSKSISKFPQGERGALIMMTSEGKLYHTNFVRTITWEARGMENIKETEIRNRHIVQLQNYKRTR